jgi:predicted alpha/beta hydrolase family esterase
LKSNPQVKNLVAHSLGSSVAVELTKQNEYKNLNVKALYASPFIDSGSKTHENRYRHSWDPISMLDRGSKSVDIGLVNPLTAHGYSNY